MRCPVCGNSIEQGRPCMLCGFDEGLWYEQYATLAPLKAEISLRSRRAEWQDTVRNRLLCPNCGGMLFTAQLDEAALRCHACGHKLSLTGLRELLSPGTPEPKKDEPPVDWQLDLARLEAKERRSQMVVTGYSGSAPFLKLPEGRVIAIAKQAFEGCAFLQGIQLPDGITFIGEAAFSDCSSLREIRIPDGVTVLQQNTFARCYQLERVELPRTLRRIEDNAFFCCNSLRELRIPDSLESFSRNAFRWTRRDFRLIASIRWIRLHRHLLEEAQVAYWEG